MEARNMAAWNAKARALSAEWGSASEESTGSLARDLGEWERRLQANELPWETTQVMIDSAPVPMERLTFGDRWVAVGGIGSLELVINAQGVGLDRLEPERITRGDA
jgi:hypothetical protein